MQNQISFYAVPVNHASFVSLLSSCLLTEHCWFRRTTPAALQCHLLCFTENFPHRRKKKKEEKKKNKSIAAASACNTRNQEVEARWS